MASKFTLTVATNGWIVRVHKSNQLMVFNDYNIFQQWLIMFLKEEG